MLAVLQVRYQLRLLVRSPLSAFTIAVIPLLLLVTLNAVTPATALAVLGDRRYIDFLTPAMAVFAVVNAAYINVITSAVLARDSGVLKRLRATPLPAWAHVQGRLVAAVVSSSLTAAVVVLVGVLALGAHVDADRLGEGLLLLLLAAVCLAVIALAVSTVVPSPDSALPFAYGSVLPLAFVSDVFFPAASSPRWLHDAAACFPVMPFAHAAESLFGASGHGWPMTTRGLLTVVLWTAGAAVVALWNFRWEPGVRHRTWRARA